MGCTKLTKNCRILRQVNVIKCFPPVALFHGSSDRTVRCCNSEEFATALNLAGIDATCKLYSRKSHTDSIIENPIEGNDPLLFDIIDAVNGWSPLKDTDPQSLPTFEPPSQMLPSFLIQAARFVNPF